MITDEASRQKGSLNDDYELGVMIGQPGQFGCAYRITSKATGQERAVKAISKAKFPNPRERKYHYSQLKNEIKVMKDMSHPNIIQLYEVYETKGHLYLVMECCAGGELFDRIKEQPSGSYSEKDAQGVAKQIIQGIDYMHQKKIAHCDLKPDNFLFLTKDKESVLKIIDFGMSKHVKRRQYLSSFRGTPYYVAPEVLEGEYSEHCDIWSFGVVLFVMLFGYPPFHGNSDDDIFRKIQKGFKNATKDGYGAWFPKAIPVSDEAKDLIAKCLHSDKAIRITAEEVLAHKWFNTDASSDPLGKAVLDNLKEFTGAQQFKAKVLDLMSKSFTDREDTENLKKMFKKFDKNGDGLISAEELKEGLESSLGEKKLQEENAQNLEELMKMADVNGDGFLSYEELLLTHLNRKLTAKEERMWVSFCKLDKDRDGTVTEVEIAEMLGVSLEEAKSYIAEVDKNSDGKIDYDEFTDMWLKKEKEQESS